MRAVRGLENERNQLSCVDSVVSLVGIDHDAEPAWRKRAAEAGAAKPWRAWRGVVTLTFASWNQITGWLGRLAALRTLREAA